MQNLKFIVFSDLHYNHIKKSLSEYSSKRKLTLFAEPLIKKLITIVNQIKPDFVVNLGDLIQDVHDKNIDTENFKHMIRILNQSTVPVYSVLGTHDLRAFDRKEVSSFYGYDNPTYSFDCKNPPLVFLSAEHIHSYNENNEKKVEYVINSKDLSWLKQDLDKTNLPTIIFTHTGLAEDNMKGNAFYEDGKYPAHYENRQDIKNILLKSNKVVIVFNGHQHWTKSLVEDGIKYQVCGSMVNNVNYSGTPDGVWLEVNAINGNLNIKEHHLTVEKNNFSMADSFNLNF